MSRIDVSDLQDILDAVPDNRTVACLPTQEFLILHDGQKEIGQIPLNCVKDVSVLVDSLVQRHFTIGRILMLGPLALLFPKKTYHETYRLCIQWKDTRGEYHYTYIRIPSRIMADHMLKSVERALTPEGRKKLAPKAPKTKGWPAAWKEEQHKLPGDISPFITCRNCTVEFRKTDLPPGGKCPVCSKRLNVDAGRW